MNQLTSVPESLLKGLASLKRLKLNFNKLSSLPDCSFWVAVKELKLNYYIGETLLDTIYPLW